MCIWEKAKITACHFLYLRVLTWKWYRLQIFGSEVHFRYVCPVYNDLRDELYTVIDKFHPSFMYLSTRDKFIHLFRNTAVVNSLAKFVYIQHIKLHSSYLIDLATPT